MFNLFCISSVILNLYLWHFALLINMYFHRVVICCHLYLHMKYKSLLDKKTLKLCFHFADNVASLKINLWFNNGSKTCSDWPEPPALNHRSWGWGNTLFEDTIACISAETAGVIKLTLFQFLIVASIQQVNLKVQFTVKKSSWSNVSVEPSHKCDITEKKEKHQLPLLQWTPSSQHSHILTALTPLPVSPCAHFFICEPSHSWHPTSCFMAATTQPFQRKQKDRWLSTSPSHRHLYQKQT